jgi:hypothetical protein
MASLETNQMTNHIKPQTKLPSLAAILGNRDLPKKFVIISQPPLPVPASYLCRVYRSGAI